MNNSALVVTVGAAAVALGICLFVAGALQGEPFLLFGRIHEPMEVYLSASALIALGVGSIVFATRARWSASLDVE